MLITIITLIFAFIFKSDFFLIENISVEGNYIVSIEEIINTSGIDVGSHIYNYNKNESKDRIRNFSYIKDVEIKRSLPKDVHIVVEEREAYLQFAHLSSFILIDKEGYILDIKDSKVENLPVFIGFNIEDHTIDNILEETEIKKLESFIADESTTDIISKMNEIIYEDDYNTNINLINGISVAFGQLNNVKYKLTLLNDILIHIEENQINTDTILMNKGENPVIITND